MSAQSVREWYDYRKMNSYNALIGIVAGPPRIGKTYGAKRDAVRDALRTGRQAIWLRRSLTELNPAKDGFFDSIAGEYPGYEFKVSGYHGMARLLGSDEDWFTIIRFVALSVSYQMKGTEFPSVDRIIYDECFTPPGGRYLEDELEKLKRLWFTVNSSRVGRDGRAAVRILMLGNPLELDNPYFLEWYFHGQAEWQKGAETGGDVVLHLINPDRYERRITRSIYGGAISEVDIEYAGGRYFEDDRGMVVPKRPQDSKPLCTLVTLRGTFSLWESADWRLLYVDPTPLHEGLGKPVVAFEPMAVGVDVVLADANHYLRKCVRRHYKGGAARFVTQRALAARQAIAR